MHVDPINTCVESGKRPRYQRLKLQCGYLLSRFAFNFNLRRYSKEMVAFFKQQQYDTEVENSQAGPPQTLFFPPCCTRAFWGTFANATFIHQRVTMQRCRLPLS